MKAITQRALTASQCKDGLKSQFCVVLGLQWGHEGKSKLLNKLCPGYDYSCRFNGGVMTDPVELDNGDQLAILPHGIKFENKIKSVLGNGVVIDPQALLGDFKTLSKNGIGFTGRLIVSDRCSIVTGFHHLIANRLHQLRGDSVWLSGQDVTHSFKPIKMALRVSHLVDDWTEFVDKYHRVQKTCEQLYNLKLDKQEEEKDLENFKQLRGLLVDNKLVNDTVVLLNKEIQRNQRILVEDASSSSMDIDTGLYPYVDSFHTTTGAVCTGLGIPEAAIETTIGVFSAVSIIRNEFLKRIEDFPTLIKSEDPSFEKIKNRLEQEYQILAKDYAFGWTDLNLIRHADKINKLSSIMLTHLDVLNDLDVIKIAEKYTLNQSDQKGPESYDWSLPSDIDVWEKVKPVYLEMPGWKSDISEKETFEELPIEAQSLVRQLEKISKRQIQYISVNDQKDEGILRILR